MEENNNHRQESGITDNDELVRCKQQYAYLQADFDNYRKRTQAQHKEWTQTAQAEVLTQLIDIIDDFDRAQQDITNPAFDLLYKAFKKFLGRFNVTEITENIEFNPHIHEAIMQMPRVESAQPGTIAQVLQKGYRMGATVLRPAKVAVYE